MRNGCFRRLSVGLYIPKSICKESLTNIGAQVVQLPLIMHRVTGEPSIPTPLAIPLRLIPGQGVAKTELYLGKNVRMIWMLMLCLAFFLLLPLKTFRKISTFFSMRILTKSLVEQGLFFFCLVLILSHAFVPERDGMCHKSEQSSWWRFAGHFKFLWHQKSVSLISRQQKPLSSLQGWLSVEKNCFAVCERASFGPNVSGSVVFVRI